MAVTAKIYLLDGPLMALQDRRLALVEEMAHVLCQQDAYADPDDARRALRAFGYSALDIEVLLDDARQAAVQDAVALEMSRP